MKAGINANYIMNEYKRKQYFGKKARQKCKDKNCIDCKFQEICINMKEE